jgi:protein SCO1
VAGRPAVAQHRGTTSRILRVGAWLVGGLAVVAGAFVVSSALSGNLTPRSAGGAAGGPSASPNTSAPSAAAAIDVASYLLPVPRAAPPIELTDPTDTPFSLTSLRGGPAFVFFGYTHCPDVCPATIGTVGLTLEAFGPGARAVFVSVDPERDTTAWLREYVRFLPAGFVALTGTSTEIRTAADAWDVRYARVETGPADAYSMSHTADVFLIDAAGSLRARLPFGTSSEAMTAVLRTVAATPITPATTSPSDTPQATTPPPAAGATPVAAPVASLGVDIVSSSVWASPAAPVILALSVDGTRLDDETVRPTVQLVSVTGERIGAPVAATPVRPPGVDAVSYVATVAIPVPGAWRLEVTATVAGRARVGGVGVDALDEGATASLGAEAPTIHTPTLADAGGVVRAVTTDPAPDLRLSGRSTTDALAAGQSFVLVVDSSRFKVSPACGRAIIMARYMLDRWRDVAFIHLEPYRYSVVADTAVLDGTLEAPTLTDPAATWGIGGDPWGPASMPWVFIVDGNGIVRAKYQGVTGSDDVDVIVALIAYGG